MAELHKAYTEKKKDAFFGGSLFMSSSKLFEENRCMLAYVSWRGVPETQMNRTGIS